MIIKNEIKLHQYSVDYMNDIFSRYVETGRLKEIVTNPIIHMYAREDTYDQEGQLNGYKDALFSEILIYDTKDMTVWKSSRFHDGICAYEDLNINQIKIFKDGSTLIALNGDYHIEVFQEINIKKV